jgi:hypothetical protein
MASMNRCSFGGSDIVKLLYELVTIHGWIKLAPVSKEEMSFLFMAMY